MTRFLSGLLAGLLIANVAVGMEFRLQPVAFTGQEGINFGLGPNLPSGEPFKAIVREPIINNAGEVAVRAFIDSAGGTDESVWTTAGGPLSLAARKGTVAAGPALGDDFFFRPLMDGFSLADDGTLILNHKIRGPGIGPSGLAGAWAIKDGTTQVVALRESVQYGPGIGTNSIFVGPSASHSGNKIYTAGTFGGGGVTTSNNWGFWEFTNGSLVNIFRSGNSLASYGMTGGGVLQQTIVQSDDTDRQHLTVTYGGSGNSSPRGTRIYSGESGNYELVAGTGVNSVRKVRRLAGRFGN